MRVEGGSSGLSAEFVLCLFSFRHANSPYGPKESSLAIFPTTLCQVSGMGVLLLSFPSLSCFVSPPLVLAYTVFTTFTLGYATSTRYHF